MGTAEVPYIQDAYAWSSVISAEFEELSMWPINCQVVELLDMALPSHFHAHACVTRQG
jgi:hypothetical protein